MAVIPTGAIYKALYFDGESSRNYGVYITGEAVYNSPERDVEMIKIPGRNGEFALDNGRFENIEVTYPAGIFADNEADFAEAISDFRNFLASRTGYCRLEDDYNPTEYRMAVYKSGLDVDAKVLKAGEFDIVFDCKPQRWLTSGETAVTIGEWGETETVSGDIVSVENPNGILAVKSLEVDLEPIQSGSGTPSPTNVRPISGHDSVDTNRTGINIWDEEWELGRLDFNKDSPTWGQNIDTGNQIRSTNYVSVKPSTSYYCKSGTASTIYAIFYDAEKHPVMATANDGYVQIANRAFTTPSDAHYIRFYCTNTTTYNNDISINYPSTDTEYHAYQGTTYTTALGRTVYGGTLDVTSGELVVDRAYVDLGTLTWAYDATNRVFRTDPIAKSGTAGTPSNLASDRFESKAYGSNNSYTSEDGVIWLHTNGGLRVRISAYTDVTSFVNGVSGSQLVYPLATPQTYQLTAQQIDLLIGQNNIWSDSGDITLEYGQNPSVLVNPTLFESGPLLETAGHGTIEFNGYSIEFEGVPIGEVQIAEKTSWTMESTKTTMLDATGDFTFDTTLLNTGDPIYPEAREFEIRTSLSANYGKFSDEGFRTTPTNVLDAHGSAINKTSPKRYITRLTPDLGDGFVYGTAKTVHCSAEFRYQYGATESSMSYWFETVDVTIAYDGTDTYTVSVSSLSSLASAVTRSLTVGLTTPTIYGNSSKPNTDPILIDCDLGEAYTTEGGVYRSLNQYIDLGSDLPKLGVGENEITFDDTITELKVTPRWWKV